MRPRLPPPPLLLVVHTSPSHTGRPSCLFSFYADVYAPSQPRERLPNNNDHAFHDFPPRSTH